ncbi:MAG: glycosyltransferase family 39 protein [Chloroflexi bacterium]|nr:glycosyltransferase family 39 protein [Chloroflexota bacterium]
MRLTNHHMIKARLIRSLPELVALACVCFVYGTGLANLKSSPAFVADDMETLKHIHPLTLESIYSLRDTVLSVAYKSMEHAPLYFVGLNIWQGAAGYDLFTARLLSVYFAVLAVAVIYQLGRLGGDCELAYGAAIALSFYAFFVHYAYVVRMYTLLSLLAGWLLWAYWRVIAAGGAVSIWRWLSLFLATAIIIYVHYFGFVLLAALGCYHLVFARKDRRWLAVSLVMTAACLLFIGWLPVTLRGFERSQAVLTDLRLPFPDALQTILSISANGLWFIPVLAGIAIICRRKQLPRVEIYLFVVAGASLLGLLLLNEITPTLAAIRMRYIIVLATPMCCAMVIGLRRLPGWHVLRWLFLAMWAASYFAFSGSEDLQIYTGRRFANADQKTHLQEFIYESERLPIIRQPVLSMRYAAQWEQNGLRQYYRSLLADYADIVFIGYEDGALWIENSAPLFGTQADIVANATGAWVIHNPQQTDLAELAYYRDWFSQHYRSCGNWLEKPKAIIAFYLQHAVPCQLITAEQPFAAAYDNGAQLGNFLVEQTDAALQVFLWWQDTINRRSSYTLELFDDAGEALALVHAPIADDPLDISLLDIANLPAGDFVLKLTVRDAETGQARPGRLLADGRRFESELALYTFSLGR